MKRVAVIGGGIGGMSSAALLRREGFEVTLLEASRSFGGKARTLRMNGVTLDEGPTLLTMPHVVRALFQDLGALDLLPRFHRLEEHCRYTFADGCTLSAFDDVERTADSAAELRPHERAGTLSFYKEAAALYRAAGEPYLHSDFDGATSYLRAVLSRGLSGSSPFALLGSLDGMARRHFKTDHLRQFVGRFATYAGASPYESSAAFAMIPHLERAFGVHHVEGGMGGLATALEQVLRRNGVRLLGGQKAQWERRSDGGYAVEPLGERFDAVVVNADPLSSLNRGDEPLSLSGFVLLVEVAERLSLPHHSILFSPNARAEFSQLFSGVMPEEPTLYLCHPAATDPTMAPEGKSGVYLMVNAPPLEPEHDWEALSARLTQWCLARFEKHVPGVRAKSTVLARRTPLDFAALGAPSGSLYGFLPHGVLGTFRRPRIQGPQPGLFFCGGGTHPGGGVPLVMLSARFAAERARAHLGVH